MQSLTFATSAIADGNMAFSYGDVAEVAMNRERFLARLGTTPERCVVIEPVHGDHIVAVGDAHRDSGVRAPGDAVVCDALMTQTKNLCLFLPTADCLPVVLHDPEHGALALAHLGWKPTGLHLLERMVEQMHGAYGTDPTTLQVHIGPSIRKESYRLDSLKQADSPDWQPFLERGADGKIAVDLVGFNIAQLLARGVQRHHIALDETDTATSPDYFSHFRSVRTGEPEGRIATAAFLR